jgi:hypothetical protein
MSTCFDQSTHDIDSAKINVLKKTIDISSNEPKHRSKLGLRERMFETPQKDTESVQSNELLQLSNQDRRGHPESDNR